MELSIAYALKKDKILVFYEKGLSIDGVLNDVKRKIPFEKDKLFDNIICGGIIETIYKFKEDLIGDMYFPFYMFEEIYAIRKIINKKEYEIREKRTVVSLNNNLKEIPYSSRVISERDIDISVKNTEKDFSFEVLNKPSNVNVKYKITRNYKHELKFITIISPQLIKGEKISYQFKIKRRNLKKYYKEDIDLDEKHQYDVYERTYYQKTNSTITQPTKKLILEVEFPENYKIKDYGCYVFLKETSNRNEDEEKRVKVEKIDRINMQILKLEVMYPKINHDYYLHWEPPSRKELENMNFKGD